MVLRDLLYIPDDPTDPKLSSVPSVAQVRDPMEHIDERFDRLVLGNVLSISDRHVSTDGTRFRSYRGDDGVDAGSFRVFIPAAG
jgi:hypothetical protein